VDADTGWGGAFMIARTIRELARAGAAGCHIEDQVQAKRCGHRPGKRLVSSQEMCDRIKAAADAREDTDFVLIARTDAHALEGPTAALDRAAHYAEAGADIIFAEALKSLGEFRHFAAMLPVPVLANMTEFGETPLISRAELAEAGIAIALYPLTAFRAMSAAAAQLYTRLRVDGDQRAVLDGLQTRAELYEVLRYHDYERELDRLFGTNRNVTAE
jgi:methylisocitrate lyase